jgi:hypothetical protein
MNSTAGNCNPWPIGRRYGSLKGGDVLEGAKDGQRRTCTPAGCISTGLGAR